MREFIENGKGIEEKIEQEQRQPAAADAAWRQEVESRRKADEDALKQAEEERERREREQPPLLGPKPMEPLGETFDFYKVYITL